MVQTLTQLLRTETKDPSMTALSFPLTSNLLARHAASNSKSDPKSDHVLPSWTGHLEPKLASSLTWASANALPALPAPSYYLMVHPSRHLDDLTRQSDTAAFLLKA